MNSTRVEMVERYIQDLPQTPLRFSKSSRKINYTGNVDDLVLDILDRIYYYCSMNTDNIRETGPRRRRSVLDIWRHTQFYIPDLTIFEVMRSLFRLGNKNLISSLVCPGIGRRVFTAKIYYPYHYMAGQDIKDEFRLTFYDWETIGLPEKVKA